MAKFFWTQKQDIGPKARRGHGLAYDSNRRRTVLFGGDSILSGLFNDTWEWDGENWTQITDLGPDPRVEFAMASDSFRGKTVLFGGLDGNNKKLFDTWEWDGDNWTQVEDKGPTPRSGHAMAFDPKRKRMVLFGGSTEGNLADTWEWDGEQWTQTGEAGPAARKDHKLAYDNSKNQIILFGGWNGEIAFNDTWSWDGETWTQVADIGPEPRHHAALVSLGNRLVLFGGLVLTAPQALRIDGGTWEWVEKRWVQRTNFGPSARWGHAMAFDDVNKRLVLFGGLPIEESEAREVRAARLLGDTWEHFVTAAAVEPAPAGMIEAFVLTPNSATFEAIAAVHTLHIDGNIRLAEQFLQTLSVSVVGDMPGSQPFQVQIPPGIRDYHTDIIITSGAPVGIYTFHAKLADSDQTATFTIT